MGQSTRLRKVRWTSPEMKLWKKNEKTNSFHPFPLRGGSRQACCDFILEDKSSNFFSNKLEICPSIHTGTYVITYYLGLGPGLGWESQTFWSSLRRQLHSLIAQPSSPLGRAIHPHCGPEGWMGEALARTKGGGLTKLVTGSAEAGCVLGFRMSGTSRTYLALIFFFF